MNLSFLFLQPIENSVFDFFVKKNYQINLFKTEVFVTKDFFGFEKKTEKGSKFKKSWILTKKFFFYFSF